MIVENNEESIILVANCVKTTVIESIRNECFESSVSSVADELRIDPDYSQSHTSLILNDSSCLL